MTVKISDPLGRPLLRLNRDQKRLFESELKAALRRKPKKGTPRRVRYDCIITVKHPGRPAKIYRLYARAALVDMKTQKAWPFFFGMLILEWIEAALPPFPQVKARPVPI